MQLHVHVPTHMQKCSDKCLKYTLRSETILATESPLKMAKNAFYLTLKTAFVLKIFKFLS